MTESLDLAKEWAVYQPEGANGWVHKFALETEGLKILDFQGKCRKRGGTMAAYSKAYLEEVIENQGKLFDYVASNYPDMDTEDFIYSYMKSNTRKYVDEAQAYVCTMDAKELWEYFQKTDGYKLKKGVALKGVLPDWIGEFYAYYQWQYEISSKNLIDKVPLDYLIKAYAGLHDLDLELAAEKVGSV